MKTSDQYFNDRIAKLTNNVLGFIIGTPALVIIITEILMKTI